MVEPALAVKTEFESLTSVHQQAVLDAPIMQNRWVEKVATQFDLEEIVVRQELERIAAIRSGEIEELVSIAEQEAKTIERLKAAEAEALAQEKQRLIQRKLAEVAVIQERLANGVSPEDASRMPISESELLSAIPAVVEDYTLAQAMEIEEPSFGTRERQTYTKFMTDIVSALKDHPQGLSKTQILSVTRRNGTYRAMRDEILLYLQNRRLVRAINNRYVHTQNLSRVLETDFHRRVYECLAEKPLSITGIVTLTDERGRPVVGYNNASGRRKVKQVLDLLWREGLVRRNTTGQYYIVRPDN